MKNYDKLLCYMRGFRKGAATSAFTDSEIKVPAFRAGWDDGRIAVQNAYVRATKVYKVEFSPLRTES